MHPCKRKERKETHAILDGPRGHFIKKWRNDYFSKNPEVKGVHPVIAYLPGNRTAFLPPRPPIVGERPRGQGVKNACCLSVNDFVQSLYRKKIRPAGVGRAKKSATQRLNHGARNNRMSRKRLSCHFLGQNRCFLIALVATHSRSSIVIGYATQFFTSHDGPACPAPF